MEGTEFGRYRLLDPLGAGAMGEVHRAYDTGTERMVAVKVLSREFAQDTVYRRRFQREAQLVARLHEPHIVPIHDFGEIDGRLFLEMRLVEAPNLASLLADKGSLPPAEAVAVVTQIAAALDAAHAGGVVHRDVKPSNILITAEGFAYLIDFGIARSSQDTTLTRAGTMIGTLAYMAPERLTLDEVDARSDVYSLACVLYECLAGTKPYTGESVERQIAAHLTERPPLPSAAGLPSAFDAVVARGLAKDPDQRYGSAGELAAAARQALVPSGLPVTGTQSAGTAPENDLPADDPQPGDPPVTDSRAPNPPIDNTSDLFARPDTGTPVITPADDAPTGFLPAENPPGSFSPADNPPAGAGFSPADNPPSSFSPADNPPSSFSLADNPPAGFSPADNPPGRFRPGDDPPGLAPLAGRSFALDTPNDHPPATRSRTRAKTAAAVAALLTAIMSVSALALTREGTTTVTDAPVPTMPSRVPATVAPGDPAAELAPAPAPGPPGQERPSETHTAPMVPSAPPAAPATTVTEHTPTTPASEPVDEETPAPAEPPLPTTTVAAPSTTTTTEPTGTPTSPTTTTDPGTGTPTTTPSTGETTTTTTPPETTGTGEETSAAASSGTSEQPRPRGSAIATSSGHVPATASPATPLVTPAPASTSAPISPPPGSSQVPR
ncbi:serine/threonine-protein kinase [Nocardia testacea]|uniref:serine/threonine-protein kinase n=1 Tax=Nocardia testacea TaxID=248551 RepID=UPI001FE0DD57|nr:serine/threonine-protein kinase [Nocardia testacea]